MGRVGAERLGDAIKSVDWDSVICSDLPRTRTTFSIIHSRRTQPLDDVTVHYNPVVREVNFGIREGQPSDMTVKEAKKVVADKLGVGEDTVIDTGESEDDVKNRQLKFLGELGCLQDLHTENEKVPPKVLCVTHGGFIRRFLSNFANYTANKIPNCSITTIEVTYCSNCDYPPDCRILDVCEVSHLGPLVIGEEVNSESLVNEYPWPPLQSSTILSA